MVRIEVKVWIRVTCSDCITQIPDFGKQEHVSSLSFPSRESRQAGINCDELSVNLLHMVRDIDRIHSILGQSEKL